MKLTGAVRLWLIVTSRMRRSSAADQCSNSVILRTAAERLLASGHPGGLDGYQSGDPQRVYLLSAAIYSAIAGMALHYAEPPASFESRGQKVRRPGTIEEDRLATCLDTTLLFAAALEAVGLHPVILMFQGHAAAGVSLWLRSFEPPHAHQLARSRRWAFCQSSCPAGSKDIRTSSRSMAPMLCRHRGVACHNIHD